MALPLTIASALRSGAFSESDAAKIERAYKFALAAHVGQIRRSGEPYINHVSRVVENLLSFGADADTLAAGFLHDTIEDCGVKEETIEKEFGKEVVFLVRGVSKLGNLKYKGRERYAENLRHLFIATAHDIRVILIKLADRLDNIRTLSHVPETKQKRIALETLEIYAPLANRLGMNRLKTELEDKAFPFVDKTAYERVRTLIKERGSERKKYIEKIYKSLVKLLAEEKISDVCVDYRIKGTYAIYQKLLKYDMDVAKVYDLYALRVITKKIEDCYRVLGLVHGAWKPLPGRIKDYIANPKINGYQSLHTTVFTGDGGIAEIQVRTEEMHREAEFGIAAHLLYKEMERPTSRKRVRNQMVWLEHIKDLHRDSGESEEFLSNLKIDFFEKRIFAFTPLGDVIELPEGATALDFAYFIHSDIGNHMSGAKVGGKLVPLDAPLKSGDIVEIQTKKGSRPTRKWLDHAKTSFAKKYIRAYLRGESKTAKS